MPSGYWGQILRVDLSSGRISVDEHDEKYYRTYFGGRGIVAQHLLREVPAHTNPLGPENVLVFAPSMLTGTAIPGSGRSSAGAKSPLTGGYGEGEGGGDWGVKLRWAGYDGLVITGRSETPVFLWINNETVELRDASHVWGQETLLAHTALLDEVGDGRASIAIIGPAAERLVRFACIALGMHNYIGRTGLGAVMGSKKLKAIAVNGKKRPEVADKEEVMGYARWMRDRSNPAYGRQEHGTARGVASFNAAGGLPTRNFREGTFEGVETITGQHMTEQILVGRESCYGCPVHCKRVVGFDQEDLSVSSSYGGPEYETIAAFGSNCGVSDLLVVAKANELCNRNTLDTISAGMMISGAMECAGKNLIPDELLQGLDLRMGSTESLLGLLLQIIHRVGLGDILAEGPNAVVDRLGPEVAPCFLHIKNQPLPLHEPRLKPGMGLGYALSPTGADHNHNVHDPFFVDEDMPSFAAARNLGILDAVDTFDLSPAKARLFTYMLLQSSLPNSLSLCSFIPYSLEQMVGMVRAATGWDVSDWELLKGAERALNAARAFNAREGFSAEHDVLPDRFFEPLEGSGPLVGRAIDRDEFRRARDLVYDMLGWDRQTAAPKYWKLVELGLDWIAEDLDQHGFVVEREP